MAAYAAAVSLMHILDLLKNHPSPPISLDKQQFDSLTEIVTFLQEFLEGYISPFSYSDEADPLEMRIAEAVYAAEDVIESYIVDNIHRAEATTAQDDDDDGDDGMESYTVDSIQLAAAATHHEDEHIQYINFYEGMQKVIEAMDLIKKEVIEMETDRDRGKGGTLEAELQRNIPVDAGLTSSSIESKSEMVGSEEELLKIKERLVGGDSNRQIIPIVGMGGIGKTTLARNVFDDQLIKENFHIRVWATISQDCNIEQTLREVLTQAIGGNSGGEKNVDKLGDELYQYLFGRKYLVVLDDMWSIEAWDKMRHFFPSHERNGSRIIVTTRMSNLVVLLSSSSNSLYMSFLNEVDSWNLFSKTVVGIGPELREIGEKIVGKCKGLPLSIAVIGGLLAKSKRTQEYWEYIEKNLNSIVNSENEEYCLRVLKLSYNHLPVYLKPCFLYMGMFDEDRSISMSMLIRLWISEGFLKTGKNKSMRTIAKECLKELVDRNLIILVHEVGPLRNMKYLKIHDLLRDLSLKEAGKQKFYYVLRQRSPHSIDSQRRIVIPGNTSVVEVRDALLSPMTRARSYVCHNRRVQRLPDSRLLRTLNAFDDRPFESKVYSLEQFFELVNSRLLVIGVFEWNQRIPSSIEILWNLHTLIMFSWTPLTAPVEIWEMQQLEHVEFTSVSGSLYLPFPPASRGEDDMVIMKNLHTLKRVRDFDLNEDTVKRIPNIKKLNLIHDKCLIERVSCLRHLGCLRQLENLTIVMLHTCYEYMQRISFPESLKKFTLRTGSCLELGEMLLQKIGSLPRLQKLKLRGVTFRSPTWETVEGQFPSLRLLQLQRCSGLKEWSVSDSFPHLQELHLWSVMELEEIPLEIGERGTLRSIWLLFCPKSVVESAKNILEEEEESNGEQSNLHVRVVCETESEAEDLQGLSASPNFDVRVYSSASSSSSQPPPKF